MGWRTGKAGQLRKDESYISLVACRAFCVGALPPSYITCVCCIPCMEYSSPELSRVGGTMVDGGAMLVRKSLLRDSRAARRIEDGLDGGIKAAV